MESKELKKMWIADQGDGTYINPILYTDYSDPDAIRVGEDYFMVASSFVNTPAVPLLHSRDLVNWKVINYICENLPFERFNEVQHGCGAWAPSIRFHEGMYYVFIPFPDEGIFMSCTEDPWGKWSELKCVHKVTGWIDPCPFWDDDGRAYMVNAFARSRIGIKSFLYMSPMKPDCSAVIDEGGFVFDGHAEHPTIEGPKMHKRNGYYYIFAPAGGVATGWQTVLRSRNVYGPYEAKIVMRQGDTPVNGPHQGAWVDTPDGQDWFLHFQDVGNAGRIVHLQPMKWVDDWPVIGEDTGNGWGKPVLRYEKPHSAYDCAPDAPEDSDLFEGETLGLQWQWNANHSDDWYSMDNGLLLRALPTEKDRLLCDMPHLLTQKWPAPEFMVTTQLDMENMQPGDRAGLVLQGNHFAAVCAEKTEDGVIISFCEGDRVSGRQAETAVSRMDGSRVWLRMRVEAADVTTFEYSADGNMYAAAGGQVHAAPGQWVGAKTGLFAACDAGKSGGFARFGSFIYEALK